MRYQRRRRAGFTLVEMLVATALVLVIMLIITQAFASASKTFTTMRTAGYMQERLRTGINITRKDLSSDHFGPPYGSARGGPHVSDQRLDQAGWQPARAGYLEFRQLGEITGGPSIFEPILSPTLMTDGDGLTSTRATNHVLQFTVRLPDGPATELFSAQFHPAFTADSRVNSFINPQSILYSRWAEVAYFLVASTDPATSNTKIDGSGLPLFTLRRRIRLLAPASADNYMQPGQALQVIAQCQAQFIDVISPYIAGPAPDAIKAQQGPNTIILRMPGPEALNLPDLDWTPTAVNQNNPPQYVLRMLQDLNRRGLSASHPTGDDIVMTDVLSFDVKAAWFNNPTFNTLQPGSSPFCSPQFQTGGILPSMFAGGNMDEPFFDLQPSVLFPGLPRVFDTGTRRVQVQPSPPNYALTDPNDWDQPTEFLKNNGFSTVPTRINVKALQIKLRVWDPRAEQARQATIVSEI